MYIKCEKRKNDNRYFVTASINLLGLKPFEVDFLIDTGACITVLNSVDIHIVRLFDDVISRIFITRGGSIRGIGGLPIETHRISPVFINFNSSIGKHQESTLNLAIGQIHDLDKRPNKQYSILGIDVLQRFDILFRDRYAYLRKK